jgi:CelD/BcsL family acetyltransferase involved in cellulose biosynthesis
LAQFNRARFERIGIVGGFRDPQLAAFHRDLLPRLASSGVARLFVLWSQTTPIAALYLVCDKGHWCAYQSGFDLAWTEYGPGTLLDDLVMQRVMDRGEASVFDFCQGTQEYKMRYHSRLISTETIEVYGSHLTGRVARILASTRRQTAAPQKGKG